MGYRAVVIVNCDLWSDVLDQNLRNAHNDFLSGNKTTHHGPYQVVEVCHADQVSLTRIESLSAYALHNTYNCSINDVDLLKEAANKLGYRLVKK